MKEREDQVMKVSKKVISNLTKCYSIAPLTYQGKRHILVAAEKQDPCYLFDLEGNQEETVWEGPGGVMSMVQVPGSDGVFLATHKFYSPNDSKEAKIIIASPGPDGIWEIRTLVDLPHVHRFDIVTRNGVNYLIACALKSGHEYKDDWSMPGKVYAAVLPDDLSGFDEEHQLSLQVIRENMLKNHGYYKVTEDGVEQCLISCDDGVYRFTPPESEEQDWTVEKLVDEAASDAVLVDLDQDGEKELILISPFHGEHIYFYKKIDGDYKKVPINATGMAIIGINVERKSCRKTYTTITTSRKASSSVLITSSIDAKRKSFALISTSSSTPGGSVFSMLLRYFSTFWIMAVAFEPAVWKIITDTPGCPFTLLLNP